MISHRYRCIFVHIPKNGGSSIERLIWPEEKDYTAENLFTFVTPYPGNEYQTGALQHLFARNILKKVGSKTFDEYYKFSLVRNPWDKAVSQYFYLFERPDLRDYLGASRLTSFKQYLKLCTRKPHVHWQPQYLFLTDENGENIVDYIGRFEDYDASVREIICRVNGNNPKGDKLIEVQEIPRLNAAKVKHKQPYWYYYDNESRDMVSEMYREDIKRYNYSFDDAAYRTRERQLKFPVNRKPTKSLLYSGFGYLRENYSKKELYLMAV